MEFLSVRELRNRPGRVWESVRGKELILTANGRPVAILLGVEEGKLEETLDLLRQVRAQTAVSHLRALAAKAGLDRLPAKAIDTEIRAARRERRKMCF